MSGTAGFYTIHVFYLSVFCSLIPYDCDRGHMTWDMWHLILMYIYRRVSFLLQRQIASLSDYFPSTVDTDHWPLISPIRPLIKQIRLHIRPPIRPWIIPSIPKIIPIRPQIRPIRSLIRLIKQEIRPILPHIRLIRHKIRPIIPQIIPRIQQIRL